MFRSLRYASAALVLAAWSWSSSTAAQQTINLDAPGDYRTFQFQGKPVGSLALHVTEKGKPQLVRGLTNRATAERGGPTMSDASSGAGSQIPADDPEQLAIAIIEREEEAAKSDRGGMDAIKARIGDHISEDIIFRNRVGNMTIGKGAFLGSFGSRATGREPEASEKFLPNNQGNIAIITLKVYTNGRTECTSNTFIMKKSAGGDWLVGLWYNLPCPT